MYLTQTLNHLALQITPWPGSDFMRSSVDLSDDGDDVVVRLDTQQAGGSVYMSLPLVEARWLALSLVEVLAGATPTFPGDVQQTLLAVEAGSQEVTA